MNLDIQSLLNQFGNAEIDQISNKIGANKAQTQEALTAALPALLSAMKNNTTNKEGANGLISALDRDHDGSILDDIGGFISNYQNGSGEGILKHTLGNNLTQVEQGLSAKTSLDHGQTHEIFRMIAPIVMGYLGKQRKQNNIGSDSITDLLGGLTKSADNASSIDLGDIFNMLGGSENKRSGLGGLLGNLFGK